MKYNYHQHTQPLWAPICVFQHDYNQCILSINNTFQQKMIVLLIYQWPQLLFNYVQLWISNFFEKESSLNCAIMFTFSQHHVSRSRESFGESDSLSPCTDGCISCHSSWFFTENYHCKMFIVSISTSRNFIT